MVILSLIALASLIVSCTIKEDLRRQRDEKDKALPFGRTRSAIDMTDPGYMQTSHQSSTVDLNQGLTEESSTHGGWPRSNKKL